MSKAALRARTAGSRPSFFLAWAQSNAIGGTARQWLGTAAVSTPFTPRCAPRPPLTARIVPRLCATVKSAKAKGHKRSKGSREQRSFNAVDCRASDSSRIIHRPHPAYPEAEITHRFTVDDHPDHRQSIDGSGACEARHSIECGIFWISLIVVCVCGCCALASVVM